MQLYYTRTLCQNFTKQPSITIWLSELSNHWRRLVKNIGWANQNTGGKRW